MYKFVESYIVVFVTIIQSARKEGYIYVCAVYDGFIYNRLHLTDNSLSMTIDTVIHTKDLA